MIEYLERRTDSDNVESESIALSMQTGLPALCCKLMYQRGIKTASDCFDFINPSASLFVDPFCFLDMDKAVQRINTALLNNEKICIFGDYDVDGICATSVLLMYLKHLGADVFYHIPSRHNEGYGMSEFAVRLIAERGATLIITVDNGITALNEIDLANSLGMDVIVTDHHKCFGDELPHAYAIICHTRPDNTYPNTNLCGAGIALKLIAALGGHEAAAPFIPFAGLATVADVVPLFGENRALVALAIEVMNSEAVPVGLRALISVCGLDGKPINERHFSFTLSPRLNAAGRMAHASLSVDLMCAESFDDALKIANELNALNDTRRLAESEIMEGAIKQIADNIDLVNTRIIVLRSTDWNPGIIGIAASRISEKYYRPAILFSEQDGVLYGSARSTPDVNIYDILAQFASMYVRFGGHSYAAGVTMRADRFDEFATLANNYLTELSKPADFIPKCYYDAEVELADMTVELAEALEKLAPFGASNPSPMLLSRTVRFNSLHVIGNEMSHLRGRIYKGDTMLDMVAFEKASQFDFLMNSEACDILFFPTKNTWNGRITAQLRIHDFKQCDITSPVSFFFDRKPLFFDAYINNLVFICSANSTTDNLNIESTHDIDGITAQLLRNNCAGTLVICHTADGAAALYSNVTEVSAYADLHSEKLPNSPCPYNAVLIAPMLEALSLNPNHSYHNVVLYDAAPSLDCICAIAAAFPDAALYIPTEPPVSQQKMLQVAADTINRNMLSTVYSIFKSITDTPKYPNDIFKHTCSKINLPIWSAKFALIVFFELGFFCCDSNGRYYLNPNTQYRELTSSSCYRFVTECLCLFDKLYDYILSHTT